MTGEWFGLSWGHLGDLMRNTGNRTWRLYRLSIATLKTNAALSEKKQNPASSMDLCRPLCESFVLEAYRTQIKLHPHQHTQECANLGTYAQMRLPATLPKTSSTTGRLRRMVHNPHATMQFHGEPNQSKYSVESSSSFPEEGSTTRKRPSGATPTGVTALPSSLISKGSDQSTHRENSERAAFAESAPEAQEHSFSVRAADSSLTACLTQTRATVNVTVTTVAAHIWGSLQAAFMND